MFTRPIPTRYAAPAPSSSAAVVRKRGVGPPDRASHAGRSTGWSHGADFEVPLQCEVDELRKAATSDGQLIRFRLLR